VNWLAKAMQLLHDELQQVEQLADPQAVPVTARRPGGAKRRKH
jgi:hypothetical protein